MNALIELHSSIDFNKLKCAYIVYNNRLDEKQKITLKFNYTQEDLEDFIWKLDGINYKISPSNPQLYGNVWLKGGNWLERIENKWVERKIPDIPEDLK